MTYSMTPKAGPGLEPFGCLPWPLDDLLSFMVLVIWPSQAAVSGLVSLYLATSVEREDPWTLLLRRATLGPLYTVAFFLTLPVALVAIPIRCLLCSLRKPLQYSVHEQAHALSPEEERWVKSLQGSRLGEYQFGVATSNTCLLPEFLARINNISHSALRAGSIGERIVVDQLFYEEVPESVLGLSAAGGTGVEEDDVRESEGGKGNFVGGLASHFPWLDFLCVQEVFDWNYNQLLRQELHKVRMGCLCLCVCVWGGVAGWFN